MKKKSGKVLLMLCVTLLCTLFLSMTAAAEEKGALTAVDGTHITGWLKNDADSGEAAVVELHIYKDGNSEAAKVITVPEESYSDEAGNSTGDGRRVFDYKINWQELGGTVCKVEAFLVSGDKKNTSYRRHGIQTVIRSLKENGELRRGNRPGNSEKRRNTGGTNL